MPATPARDTRKGRSPGLCARWRPAARGGGAGDGLSVAGGLLRQPCGPNGGFCVRDVLRWHGKAPGEGSVCFGQFGGEAGDLGCGFRLPRLHLRHPGAEGGQIGGVALLRKRPVLPVRGDHAGTLAHQRVVLVSPAPFAARFLADTIRATGAEVIVAATADAARAALTADAPAAGAPPARFVFDPDDPTPTIGGRLLFSPRGYREDSALAARNDVVTFTGPVLTEPLEVIGVPRVELEHRSDTGWCDVSVRISEVDADGRSRNVSDGYVGRTPADTGVLRLDLDPIAHRFAVGSRIRVSIAGGSYPRFARNPGTGEPVWSASRLVRTHHEVGPGSRLVLPVV